MANLSLRIPDELAEAVARLSRSWDADSDSAIYRRVLEEWVRMQDHPGIRFADGPTGRRAALVGGPDVWEAVLMARDLDWREEAVAELYPQLPPRKLDAARRYYEAYPDEVDARIEANERAVEQLEEELDLLVKEDPRGGEPPDADTR